MFLLIQRSNKYKEKILRFDPIRTFYYFLRGYFDDLLGRVACTPVFVAPSSEVVGSIAGQVNIEKLNIMGPV